MVNCPICGRMFDLLISPAPPFCSERCRKVDLNRWLSEEYAVPRESSDEDDEEALPPRDDE